MKYKAMHKDPRKIKINENHFSKSNKDLKVLYGLPEKILFCKKCGISNQRPNSSIEHNHTQKSKKSTIFFDDNQVCDPCRLSAQKQKEIDWEERKRELMELCDKYRSRNGSYDCIVPGSGGKDSFMQSWILKYEFNMNPLTITWPPHIYTDWGYRNFQKWIHSGFDNYSVTPNGKVKRILTRLAVENLFHPFQPFIIGQKSLAPKLALEKNIPLIFYGENEAEYGNPIADSSSATRNYDYFSQSSDEEIFIGGESIASLKANYGLTDNDLDLYKPANGHDLIKKNVEVHYLGYYIKWHPQSAYYFAVEKGGFEASPERTPGTYSKYNSIDDKIDDLHYYTTFVKFGIGRATYDASQEVRSGDIDLEEAKALIKRYDGEYPERFIDELLIYLSLPEKEFSIASKMFESPIMDRDYFDKLSDQFRSPHLWYKENNQWKLRKTLNNDL